MEFAMHDSMHKLSEKIHKHDDNPDSPFLKIMALAENFPVVKDKKQSSLSESELELKQSLNKTLENIKSIKLVFNVAEDVVVNGMKPKKP